MQQKLLQPRNTKEFFIKKSWEEKKRDWKQYQGRRIHADE